MIGVVASVPTNGRVSCRLPGQEAAVSVAAGRSVNGAMPGDTVLIISDGKALFAIELLGTGPAPEPPPEEVTVQPVTTEMRMVTRGTVALAASRTGTWRNGAWRDDTDDLWTGNLSGRGDNTGAAFIDGFDAVGTVQVATLHLECAQGSGALTVLLLVSSWEPDVFPATLASSEGPTVAAGSVSEWAVPDEWLPLLQSGAAAGFGIQSSSDVMLSGPRTWATVDWERTTGA